MKFITLSVPPPFADGPQFDEDGELINGSWPAGLPYEGMRIWTQIGSPAQGKVLVEFVAEDNWPISDIPGGWLADGSMMWDLESRDEYDEDGILTKAAIVSEADTDYGEYSKHFDDPVTTRQHVIAGWPVIRQ